MKRLHTVQQGLWGGPIFVNGHEYQIGETGLVDVPSDEDAQKLLSCSGWREIPVPMQRTAIYAPSKVSGSAPAVGSEEKPKRGLRVNKE